MRSRLAVPWLSTDNRKLTTTLAYFFDFTCTASEANTM